MSSLIYKRWKQYFQMPIAESVERLSPAAYRYYGFLCREMNIHSAPVLCFSNAEIARATGIKDHKTLAKARSELETAHLIQRRKVPPGVYEHLMLDESGDPIPAPKDRKGVRHYENDNAATRKHGVPFPATPVEIKSPPITDQASTRECRTHGTARHWKRGEDWLCETCHPNPWHQPTAKEIGFERRD